MRDKGHGSNIKEKRGIVETLSFSIFTGEKGTDLNGEVLKDRS